MEFAVEVRALSHKFYNDYPIAQYPEILRKDSRPYSCLLIDLHIDYFICIPFRSEMSHNQGFPFRNTIRSRQSRSGLDYKKLILVKDLEYISDTPAVVDADEFAEMMNNIDRIVGDVDKYIRTYANHINGTKTIHHRQFERQYRFSTLSYFHDILGLTPYQSDAHCG